MKIPGYSQTSYTDVQVAVYSGLYTIGHFMKSLQDKGSLELPEHRIGICNSGRLASKVISMAKYSISLLSNASVGIVWYSSSVTHGHGSILKACLMPRHAPRLRLRLADDIKVAPDSQIFCRQLRPGLGSIQDKQTTQLSTEVGLGIKIC
jgi:hypothetical protein